jgi:hypothetical protein
VETCGLVKKWGGLSTAVHPGGDAPVWGEMLTIEML